MFQITVCTIIIVQSNLARSQQITTGRRTQNVPANGQLPDDIDALLERQIKSEKSRREYQNRPEVMEKRKEYQKGQQAQKKIARAAMKGNTAELVELGFTDDQAEAAVAKAKVLMAVS